MAEQPGRISLRRRADVAALGVQDAHELGRHVAPHALESGPAGGSPGLEERHVDLHRHDVVGGGLDEPTGERLDPCHVARQFARELVGMGVDAEAQRRAEQLDSPAESVERRGHPVGARSGSASRRARSGLAAASA
jgi:hypothetical protein